MSVRFGFTRSFRNKLLLLVLLSSVPALFLAFHRNLQQRETEKARGIDTISTVAKLIAANEGSYVKNAEQLLTTLDKFSFLVKGTDRKFCALHLENLLKLSPDYLNFGIVESNGLLFASSLNTNGKAVHLGDRSYFERTIKTRRFSVGDFQRGRITDENSLNFGYPVLNDTGRVHRVLFASLNLQVLTEAAAEVPLPFGAVVTVLDRRGTVLARLPELPEVIGKADLNPEFFTTLTGTKEGAFEAPGLDGIKRIYAVARVAQSDDPGLYVAVGIPSAILFSDADVAMKQSLLILGVVMMFALAVAYFFADRSLVGPVDALASAADRLAQGDLDSRVKTHTGTREIEELSQSFNRMADSLQKRAADIQEAHQKILQLNSDLEKRVDERTAQLTAANKELEAFSYSVSHDLRAPLRHLDGFAQLLMKHQLSRLDDKGRRHLEVISDSAKKMGALIDGLLVFSRMGKKELVRAPVLTGPMVREVIADLGVETQGRQIDWVIGDLPEVEADAGMLKQVWINLLSNAVKYTKPRELARIEITFQHRDGEYIFSVRDNGVGFDMEYSNKLFGVFQRLHTDAEFEGTGIGLANIRRIVSRHGGRTWAEARLNAGATFYFSLPCHESKK